MGVTKAKFVLSGRTPVEIELLVDTGALYTLIPEFQLTAAGVPPLGTKKFQTADGRVIERKVGEARLKFNGESRHVPVAFGESGDVPLLGVTALEIFGLEVDPTTRRLKPATLFLL